jgi:hypothetical protein
MINPSYQIHLSRHYKNARYKLKYYHEKTIVFKSRVGFAEHLSRTQAAHKGVNHFVATFAINLVTPIAAAKQELLFNKPVSMLLAKILHY